MHCLKNSLGPYLMHRLKNNRGSYRMHHLKDSVSPSWKNSGSPGLKNSGSPSWKDSICVKDSGGTSGVYHIEEYIYW